MTAPCAANAPEYLEAVHGHDPARIEAMRAAAEELEAFTGDFVAEERGGGTEIVIPVVFHIIHMNGPENISDEQVHDAMRILNEDFSRNNFDWNAVNPAFLGIVADVGISFRLAGRDPSGNCTKGITRTVSALTNVGDSEMKGLIQWPRNRYMNVWISAYANGAAGYTMYPSNVSGSFGAPQDGIVVQATYLGSIGTGAPGRSRTLTHEVGHWLNLMHVWGDSNNPGVASNCSIDDGVADTPNSIGWTTCNTSGQSCNAGLNNVENYMEYSYCSKMFTEGQKSRMLAAVNSSVANRNNLWTQANRELTGTWTENETLCAAAFASDTRIVCANGPVQFEDQSFHNPTQWNWSFPGGTPASSTQQNPTVTYAAPGTYAVTLTAGDGTNSYTSTTASYITVLSDPGQTLPFMDDFEATTVLPNGNWTTWDGAANGTFEMRTDAAYSGARSLRLRNHGAAEGTIDELISTSLDLSGLTEPPVISFRYAYRKRQESNSDRLSVYVSRDCGATWNIRAILNANNLVTATMGSAFWQPTNLDQWGYREVTNLTTAYLESDVRIKFQFLSGGGNNFWLDDVNINGAGVGFEDLDARGSTALQVFPNPVDENSTVLWELPSSGPVRADVVDALGRTVLVLHQGTLSAGEHRWQLPGQDLGSGLYLVRVRHQGGEQVVRFIKP